MILIILYEMLNLFIDGGLNWKIERMGSFLCLVLYFILVVEWFKFSLCVVNFVLNFNFVMVCLVILFKMVFLIDLVIEKEVN